MKKVFRLVSVQSGRRVIPLVEIIFKS